MNRQRGIVDAVARYEGLHIVVAVRVVMQLEVGAIGCVLQYCVQATR